MTPLIVGHRGLSGHYPENTRVSVQAAIDFGLKWVEIDVQPTKDNVFVLCHDYSNGEGRIDEHELEALRQFDFGGWFNDSFANESIMTLEEPLILAAEHDLCLNIEVKIDRHDVAEVARLLKAQLNNGPLAKTNIIFSSFNYDIMRQLRQCCPGYKLGLLSERLSEKDWEVLEEINAFSCHLNYRQTKGNHISELHAKGYQVWCYTVNETKKFKQISKVDAIFTDHPERLL